MQPQSRRTQLTNDIFLLCIPIQRVDSIVTEKGFQIGRWFPARLTLSSSTQSSQLYLMAGRPFR